MNSRLRRYPLQPGGEQDSADSTNRTSTGGTVPETRRSFDDQLKDIRTEVVTLAAKTCEQIGAVMAICCRVT